MWPQRLKIRLSKENFATFSDLIESQQITDTPSKYMKFALLMVAVDVLQVYHLCTRRSTIKHLCIF